MAASWSDADTEGASGGLIAELVAGAAALLAAAGG